MTVDRGQWQWREQGPTWPRRQPEEEDQPARHRWRREPEPYEDRAFFEPYPGATVLEDLSGDDDGAGAIRILARYAVARIMILSAAGQLEGSRLRAERRVALEHLALIPAHEWERYALQRLAALCRETPPPSLVDAAFIAAECAVKRGHRMGGFGLYRAAWELSCQRRWWTEAARAADGIARLARLDEARVAARVWTWRTRVLRRRAAKHGSPGTPVRPAPAAGPGMDG
jgi:hypothetical protein